MYLCYASCAPVLWDLRVAGAQRRYSRNTPFSLLSSVFFFFTLRLVLWRAGVLQGPSDVVRDRAAAVLASLPLCGEAEAWTQAAGRVALEAHGCVHVRLRCAQMKGFTY